MVVCSRRRGRPYAGLAEEAPLTSEQPILAVDDEETWPAVMLSMLDEKFEALRQYEELARKFALMGTSAYLEAGQPRNQFRDERDSVVDFVGEQVRDRSLVGFHCTRLVVEEIEEVKRSGLQPLSPELANRRVTRLEQAGYLDPDIAARLRSKNVSTKETRKGKTCFIFTRNDLTEEYGVGPLLAHWGGEALYYYHADDPDIGPRLGRIGIACIVEAELAATQVVTVGPIGERLVSAYLGRRAIRTGSGAGMTGYIREATAVRRLIRRDDPEFESLTGCGGWTMHI
jgi:hypothetical protein